MQLDLLQAIQNLRAPWLTTVFEWITTLGSPQVVIVLAPLVFWCISTRRGYQFLAIVLFSAYLNSLLKESMALVLSDAGPLYATRPYQLFPQHIWTCRSDPSFNPDALLSTLCREEESFAFPSGHAQGSFVAWVYVAVLVRRRWVWALSIAAIVLIGVSRMYLGQHWPTDILGGWLIGAALLSIAWALLRLGARRPRLVTRVLLALMLGATALFALLDPDPTLNRARTLGLIAGASLGYLAYLRQPPFAVQAPRFVQAGKIGIGVLGVALIQLGLGQLLPDDRVIVLLLGVLTGAWVTLGAPRIFRAVFGAARTSAHGALS